MNFPRMFKGNICATVVTTAWRQCYNLQWDSYMWEHSVPEFCLKLSFFDCYFIRNWSWLVHSGIARVWVFFNCLYMFFSIVKKILNSEWPLCGDSMNCGVSIIFSVPFSIKKKKKSLKILILCILLRGKSETSSLKVIWKSYQNRKCAQEDRKLGALNINWNVGRFVNSVILN